MDFGLASQKQSNGTLGTNAIYTVNAPSPEGVSSALTRLAQLVMAIEDRTQRIRQGIFSEPPSKGEQNTSRSGLAGAIDDISDRLASADASLEFIERYLNS